METLKYKLIKNGKNLLISLKRSDGFHENLNYIEVVKPLVNHNTHKSIYRTRDIKGKFIKNGIVECNKCKEIFKNKLHYEIHLTKCKAYDKTDIETLKHIKGKSSKGNKIP